MSAFHRAKAQLGNKKSQALGALGEFVAKCMFQFAGYEVVASKIGEKVGDLKVFHPQSGQESRVEVKTARRNSRKKWCFTLEKRGHTSHSNTDYVVCLAVRASGDVTAFVIPTEVIRGKRSIEISSSPNEYRGIYSQYRQHDLLRLP